MVTCASDFYVIQTIFNWPLEKNKIKKKGK